MFKDAPRGFKDPAAVAERRAMLKTVEAVQPLLKWTNDLVARRIATQPDIVVPDFDPAEAGVDARVLLLFEAPGPMTNADNTRPGSGFISVDNNDQSAENCWRLRDEVNLTEHVTLNWNIVPWYLGPASKKPNQTELREGAAELRQLLVLLPHLRVVVTSGLYAQQGWRNYAAPYVSKDLVVIETWHPSPLSMKQPGKRDALRKALERAASLAR